MNEMPTVSEADTPDSANRPLFGTVAIVGVGLIGGSLGLALRRAGLAGTVVGVEPDPARGQAAAEAGAIHRAVTDWREAVTDADLVVLSAPVGRILECVEEVTARVKPGAVVSDVGSTKGAIVRKAGLAPFFVGGHPMTGSEKTGVEAARAELFAGTTWALTPTPHTAPQALAAMEGLAQALGAKTLTLTPDAHDEMTAATSHLPHVLASALMGQAARLRARQPDAPRLSAGSFADATRVAASSPEMWRDVCLSNSEALRAALREFRDELDVLESALLASDGAALERFFAEGRAAKRNWERG